jgi:hypothetical protein
MKSTISLRMSSYLLAAGLAFGAAAAQAASGVTITESQETNVAVGMSTTEVQQNLGRPADIVKYRNAAGPTWTYEVFGAPFGMTDFDVNFGSDGKVVSVDERVIGDH